MIVKYEGSNFLGIPTIMIMEKELILGEPVDLGPGYNDIPDALWAKAREHVLDRINVGSVKEEWVKKDLSEVEGKYPAELILESENGTEKTKRLVPAKLADIDRKGNKVILVVKETFDVKALNKWYDVELRQDVRVELQNQIRLVSSGELKG